MTWDSREAHHEKSARLRRDKQMKKNTRKGFTLIELLIVVAIIGIIAAIAIPNLLDAMNRGRYKASQGDMRSIGTGVESYKVDNFGNPPAQPAGSIAPTITLLQGRDYLKQVPTTDQWGVLIQYIGETKTAPLGYAIVSNAAKGSATVATATVVPVVADVQSRTSKTWTCQIHFTNGGFSIGTCS